MIVRQRLLNATKHGGRAFDSKKLMMFLRALEKMPSRLLATSLMGWMTVAACTAAEPSTEWPHSRGDAAMTGLSPIEIRTPLTLAWQFETMKAKRSDGEMLVSTAVVRNGKVYAGCKDGKFFCLELETGKKLWEAEAKGAFDGAAAFAGDLVVAGCQDGFIYGWNADTGKEAWKFETDAEVHASANVWTDPATKKNHIVIGSYDYNVYCLDAVTGQKEWAAETGYYINGGAAIGSNKVVFGGCDSVLHVHDVLTGKEEKVIEVGAYIGNNVAIADDVVYVSHYGNRVGAYSLSDGMRVWEYGEREFEYYSAPAIFEKFVIVGGRDKRMHGIDRITGKGLWEYKTRDQIDSSPVICGGKTVLFGSDDGYFYALNLADGKEVWTYEIGAAVKASPAVAGDWILIGADDGVLYAFKNGALKSETK